MKFRDTIWSYWLLALVIAVVNVPAHATFPGKNGRIAFVQDGEIFTMNPDGSGVTLFGMGHHRALRIQSWLVPQSGLSSKLLVS
jgi:hypothetical protein